MTKPPIGIMPQYIWREFLEVPAQPERAEIIQRITDLKAACKRYHDAGRPAPIEWGIEINLLNNLL